MRALAMRMRRPGFGIVIAAVAVLLALAFFHGALFGGETFNERDLSIYHRPNKWLMAVLAHASDGLPLWNPFYSSGQPFAGNPEHEIFFPLTWLLFVLPFEWAFRLQVMIPPFVG